MKKIKLFEMFAGYGGASFGFKKNGTNFECVGFSEVDPHCPKCDKITPHTINDNEDTMTCDICGRTRRNWTAILYKKNHGNIKNFGDATKINIDEVPNHDFLTGGFPCQSFSQAGKGLGELDPKGTLFYEIVRVAEKKQPKYMLLENVEGLTTKKHKATYQKILQELDRIGYKVYHKLLNSKHRGIPQNRSRIWFVCFRKDIDSSKFTFRKKKELKIFLKDILEDNPENSYNLSEKNIKNMKRNLGAKGKMLNIKEFSLIEKITFPSRINQKYGDIICPTLTSAMGTGGGNIPIINQVDKKYYLKTDQVEKLLFKRDKGMQIEPDNKVITIDKNGNQIENNPKIGQANRIYSGNGISPTLNIGWKPQIKENIRIRRLTERELFRLMGFLNDEIIIDIIPSSHQAKAAGNGWEITMPSEITYDMLNLDKIKNKETLSRFFK